MHAHVRAIRVAPRPIRALLESRFRVRATPTDEFFDRACQQSRFLANNDARAGSTAQLHTKFATRPAKFILE